MEKIIKTHLILIVVLAILLGVSFNAFGPLFHDSTGQSWGVEFAVWSIFAGIAGVIWLISLLLNLFIIKTASGTVYAPRSAGRIIYYFILIFLIGITLFFGWLNLWPK